MRLKTDVISTIKFAMTRAWLNRYLHHKTTNVYVVAVKDYLPPFDVKLRITESKFISELEMNVLTFKVESNLPSNKDIVSDVIHKLTAEERNKTNLYFDYVLEHDYTRDDPDFYLLEHLLSSYPLRYENTIIKFIDDWLNLRDTQLLIHTCKTQIIEKLKKEHFIK